jgi:hypothetical protein
VLRDLFDRNWRRLFWRNLRVAWKATREGAYVVGEWEVVWPPIYTETAESFYDRDVSWDEEDL